MLNAKSFEQFDLLTECIDQLNDRSGIYNFPGMWVKGNDHSFSTNIPGFFSQLVDYLPVTIMHLFEIATIFHCFSVIM